MLKARPGGIANVYIVYEISKNINISDYPTLELCLFGAIKLTKNTDIDKYVYSGYAIGFDRHGNFSFPGTGLGRNVIIFGVDMTLEHTLSARKMYSIHFTEKDKKFCLRLHYNEANSYLFVNGK